jgi:ribosomal protein L18E
LNGIIDEESIVTTSLDMKAPAAVIDDVGSPTDSKANRRMSRRLSARQFYEASLNIHDLELEIKEADDWEMVLVAGEHEESTDGTLRQQDIVFNGHSDG